MRVGLSPGSRGPDLPQGCPTPGATGPLGLREAWVGLRCPWHLEVSRADLPGPPAPHPLGPRLACGYSSVQEPWPRPRPPAQGVPAAQRPECGAIWHRGALEVGVPRWGGDAGRAPNLGREGSGWSLPSSGVCEPRGSEVEPGWWLSWLERSSLHQRLLVDPGLGWGWEASMDVSSLSSLFKNQ